MARTSVTADDLLAAIRDASPVPPGPEWLTIKEAGTLLKLRDGQVRRRLSLLVEQGKAECMMAPRRGRLDGACKYFRFKP